MTYEITNAVECSRYQDHCTLPSYRKLDGIRRGTIVKLNFVDGSFEERLWVLVSSRDEFSRCTGYVDDAPKIIENVSTGELVRFTIDNVCRIYNVDHLREIVAKKGGGIAEWVKVLKIYLVVKADARKFLREKG